MECTVSMDMGIHSKRIITRQGGAKVRMRLRPADPSSAVTVGTLRCKKKQFLNFNHNRVPTIAAPRLVLSK